jgi:3',5'-cyclic AMP phosphodiesterase CpdA
MPAHINVTSRRRFLQTTAIASLTPAFADFVWGEESKTETWAFLSDTHIAADTSQESRGTNMAANLKRVVAEVAAEGNSLAGIIVNGDLAFNDGQHGDYEIFMGIMGDLSRSGVPIHMTLGNHDDRMAFRESFADHTHPAPIMVEKHLSLIETPIANWILLDSLRYVNKVEGEIGEKQMAWLKEVLAAHPDKPAIVVGHHYPQVFREDVIPGDKKIKISGLIDSEPFLDLLHQHPQAKAYIYGHSHTWLTETDEAGLQRINLPPTAYVFDETRPNGWVKAVVSATGIEMELRPLAGEREAVALDWR